MSAIKYGEQNVAKGNAPQEHPERKGQLGADWEEKNQGENRTGPGDTHEQRDSKTATKVGDGAKRYLKRPDSGRE